MSLILSIETSTPVCSVSITDGLKIISTEKLFLEKSHSGLLTLLIQDTLKRCGLTGTQLSAIAVSEGPGSYTGLRIGVATAKGLCYTLDKPLIAVSSLEAMASEVNQFNTEGFLLSPMLDARRMEVYTATYDSGMNKIHDISAVILNERSFSETLSNKTMLFFGDGSEKFRPLVEHNSNARFLQEVSPSAWAVGQLAFGKFQKNEFQDVAYFEPFYLKEFRATVPKPLL